MQGSQCWGDETHPKAWDSDSENFMRRPERVSEFDVVVGEHSTHTSTLWMLLLNTATLELVSFNLLLQLAEAVSHHHLKRMPCEETLGLRGTSENPASALDEATPTSPLPVNFPPKRERMHALAKSACQLGK